MDSTLIPFRDTLLGAPQTNLPMITAYLDLQRASATAEPIAMAVLEQVLREESSSWGVSSRAESSSFEADAAALREAVQLAIASGSAGLAYAGCAGESFRAELHLPVPFRNDLRIGREPWLWELERAGYVHGQPVVLALVDLHTVELRRFSFGRLVETSGVDHDADRLTRSSQGRINVEGRSGGAGHAGGHSRNDVERVVEAHRVAFAREAGAEIAAFVKPDDMMLISGVPEARAQLLAFVSDDVRSRAMESSREPSGDNDDALMRFVAEEGVERRLGLANSTAHGLIAGAAGERAALGLAAVRAGLAEGRLAEAILHDGVAGHFGTAVDARRHDGLGNDAAVEEIVRSALATSASISICDDDRVLTRYEGVVGRLRW